MGDSIDTADCYPCPRTDLSPMSSTAHKSISRNPNKPLPVTGHDDGDPHQGIPQNPQVEMEELFDRDANRGGAVD